MSEQDKENELKYSHDKTMDEMFQTKLRLQSLIEATQDSTELPNPPDSVSILLMETLDQDADETTKALEYYSEMLMRAKTQNKQLESEITLAKEVRTQLTHERETPSEELQLEELKKSCENYNTIFKAFRKKFSRIIAQVKEEFPQMKISEVLQALCLKMMDSPHNPYHAMEELDTDEKTVHFLVSVCLVERDPKDSRRIRLCDPRCVV